MLHEAVSGNCVKQDYYNYVLTYSCVKYVGMILCFLTQILNRHPPFGNQIRESVIHLPKYEVTVEQVDVGFYYQREKYII